MLNFLLSAFHISGEGGEEKGRSGSLITKMDLLIDLKKWQSEGKKKKRSPHPQPLNCHEDRGRKGIGIPETDLFVRVQRAK